MGSTGDDTGAPGGDPAELAACAPDRTPAPSVGHGDGPEVSQAQASDDGGPSGWATVRRALTTSADRDVDLLLSALSRMRDLRRQLDDAERDLIDAARGVQVPWQEIAAAMGRTSAQAAEQRAQRLRTKKPGRGEPSSRVPEVTSGAGRRSSHWENGCR